MLSYCAGAFPWFTGGLDWSSGRYSVLSETKFPLNACAASVSGATSRGDDTPPEKIVLTAA
jgi:hypothetical protein